MLRCGNHQRTGHIEQDIVISSAYQIVAVKTEANTVLKVYEVIVDGEAGKCFHDVCLLYSLINIIPYYRLPQ